MIEGAIKGMVKSLDPHTSYMPPASYKQMQAETTGKFGGLGIEISIRDGVLTVVSPIEVTCNVLIFNTFPLPAALERIVVIPHSLPVPVTPLELIGVVLTPEIIVVIPVMVDTFTIFGAAMS